MSSQTRRLPVSGYAFSGFRDLPRSVPGVGLAVLVGLSAFAFSLLYLLTDLIELIQDGFSTWQLALTYAAEAAIPLFVLGLYAAQRPRIGSLGLVSALLYAYVYVFFTATVVYALVRDTSDFDALNDEFGAWMTIHGALMVLAGVGFGVAVVRARTLPRWTGLTLMVGVVFVAAASGLSDPVQTVAAATRDLAFAGMGLALVRSAARKAAGDEPPK
jgi:hypothetical protein